MLSHKVHLVCILLILNVTLVSAQTTSGETPSSGDIAPKVHQMLQLTVPIEVPGAGDTNRDDVLILECMASGNPAPIIEWSFNGVKFVVGKNTDGTEGTDKVRHIITGNKLRLNKVRGYNDETKLSYDTGRYRCIATNRVGSVFLEKHIKIRVMGQFNARNTENKGVDNYNPTVGKSYSIDCPKHTKGYGTKYRWGYLNKRLTTRTPEWWYPGNPNERVFPDYETGKLWWSVVTADDVKSSNDIGGVRCILVNNDHFEFSNQQRLFQISETKITDAKPVIVARLPEIMHAPVDTEFQLICGATGNPVPEMSWEYQGIPIRSRYNNSEELNFEFFKLMGKKNQELRIRRITKYSGGTFRCIATNSFGNKWSQGQLTVQFPPIWKKSFPDTIELALQSTFVLVCNATGTPRPTFVWYQNGTRLKNSTDKMKTVSGEDLTIHNGGILTIKNTKFSDNGIYICVAENELDTLTQSVFIRVQPKPPKFDTPLDDPIYLFNSKTMVINCKPSGGPIPTKTWSKNGGAIDTETNSRFKVLTNGSLQIYNVKPSDAGLYTCKADNDKGSAESSGTAVVLNPTNITRPIQPQRHERGWGYVVFYCGVEWDQRLDLRVEWYKEGVRMAKFNDRIYLEDRASGPPRLLYIKNLTIQDAGNYSCHAYTKVGNVISEDWAHAALTIKGPPEPPSGVEIVGNCGGPSPMPFIQWNRGEELGVETRRFLIEFSTNESSHENRWFGGEGDELLGKKDAIIAIPGTQVKLRLTKDQLVPGANLIFRIRAASDHLIGNPSRPSRVGTCITDPDVPKINPLNVTGYSKGPGKLTIRWRPLTDVYYGAPGFYYEVHYRVAKDNGQFTVQTINKNEANNSYPNEYDLQGVAEDTEYEFFVKALNEKGAARQIPIKVKATSGKQPPTNPPTNVQVASIDRFNVELKWTKNKDATSYRIRYWNITNAEALRGRNKRAASDPYVYLFQYTSDDSGGTLSNLTSQVEFVATVASVNSGGISPESSPVYFKTLARAPGIPENVQIVVYGSSAHISWNPPLHPNGYIEQYEISWTINKKNTGQLGKRTVIRKDRRAREAYMLTDFVPFTYYNLRLNARNRVGAGDDYERILFTVSAPDIPGKPGAPKAVTFDDSSINITFQRPTYGGLPTKFYVYYRPRGNYFEAPKILSQKFPKRAWILVMGLDFLAYDFWTVGVNELGQSETSDVTVQMPDRKLKPQAHASNIEWWRQNWFIAIAMVILFLLITMITVIVLLKDGPKTYKRLKEDKFNNGYSASSSGYNNKMKPVSKAEEAARSGAPILGATYAASAADRYDRSASETEDHPPPKYPSQNSLEKKRSDSETGSDYSGSETGSDYSGSETGSDYSDEDDGSYYSDEEKKRSDSEEDEEDDAEDSTFV